MDQVLKQIASDKLALVYVVQGTDPYRQKAVYQALYDRSTKDGFSDWNWVTMDGSKDLEAGQIIEELAMPTWGGGAKIVVISDAEQVRLAVWESLVKWLQTKTSANCLAIFFAKVDKRVKAIKELIKLGVEITCDNLRGATLERWVGDYVRMEGYTFKQEALVRFLDRVGDDLGLITQELEKIFLYIGDTKVITITDVDSITTIVPSRLEQGAIFEMVDAIAAKKQPQALAVLHQLMDMGEAPLRILPLIERQLRLLLAAKLKGGLSLKDAAICMGEKSDYALKKVTRLHLGFSEEELYQGMSKVIQADQDMKFGANGEYVLEQLICHLCSKSS